MRKGSNSALSLAVDIQWDAWLEALQQRKPELFEPQELWPVGNNEIAHGVEAIIEGEPLLLGESAGGRPILGAAYGEFEPQCPTATISSASASDRPAAFYDPALRSRPVLAIIGSIHGGETEGIALCMNLIHLMEHGVDLLNRPHPQLRERLQSVRLLLIPCLNPDGRARAGVTHLSGATVEELFLVQQGILQDGSLFFGRKVKETSPIPAGFMQRLGGYYNAEGVNLQHDDFFGPRLAPENRAIMELFRKEVPDAFITLHAHGAPASFITPDTFIAPGYQRKQIEAAGFILSRLVAESIPILTPEEIITPPWSFYFQTWLSQMTGALPLLFEFCHGLEGYPASSPLQNINTGFTMIGAWVEYCLAFGARPRSAELFGAITPAS